MIVFLLLNAAVAAYGASYFGFCCKNKRSGAAIATATLIALMVAIVTLLCIFKVQS
ncbi:MAG: hypothetical protein PHT58_08040 [Eubacteriales bacterium]|nr:hypothetical protein [Eubacteriales bacterium]